MQKKVVTLSVVLLILILTVGLVCVLSLATSVGFVLGRRTRTDESRAVVTNLNARINAWYACSDVPLFDSLGYLLFCTAEDAVFLAGRKRENNILARLLYVYILF